MLGRVQNQCEQFPNIHTQRKKQKVIFIYKLNNPNIQKLFIVDETIENINNCVLIILVLCMYTHEHFSEYGSYYGSNYEMNLLYKTNTLHNRLPFWSSGFNVKTNLMFQSSFFSIFFQSGEKMTKTMGWWLLKQGFHVDLKLIC